MSHYFIGIKIGNVLSRQLADWQEALKKDFDFKNWTDVSDFHITLAFLGEVGEETIGLLQQKLDRLTLQASFCLKLRKLGVFGRADRPRVLWMGMEKNGALIDLQQQVVEISEEIGYKRDKRPYMPHITLAKKWDGSDGSAAISEKSLEKIIALQQVTVEEIKVDAVQLFKVHPSSVPKYEVIQTCFLKEEVS